MKADSKAVQKIAVRSVRINRVAVGLLVEVLRNVEKSNVNDLDLAITRVTRQKEDLICNKVSMVPVVSIIDLVEKDFIPDDVLVLKVDDEANGISNRVRMDSRVGIDPNASNSTSVAQTAKITEVVHVDNEVYASKVQRLAYKDENRLTNLRPKVVP